MAPIVSPLCGPHLDQKSHLPSTVLLKYAGRDATQAYAEYHSPSVAKDSLSTDCFLGNLDRSTITEEWKREPVPSNVTQAAPEDEKPPLDNVINWYGSYNDLAQTEMKIDQI